MSPSGKRLPLHPLEKTVLGVVAIHLCFLPWALGTMHVWSQVTSLVISSLGFLVALVPRNYSSDLSGGQPMRLIIWPRLLHFPIFWIGLALLAYIAIQGFNPSWVWERNETSWWLRRVNDIEWLPTSIDTPFERFNLWRQFIIYASAWLTVCTIWIGFTRRRSLQILLTLLVANASVLAAVGIERKINIPRWNPETNLLGQNFLLWIDSPFLGATTFSSFIYKNHAGAYIALVTMAAVALAIWYFDRGEREMRKSTPAGILAFVAVFLASTVLFTLSRGASISLCLCIIVLLLWIFLRRKYQIAPRINAAVTNAVIFVFIAALIGTVRYVNFSDVQRVFSQIVDPKTRELSMEGRILAYDAGENMLSDYWLRGLGAGGFRYLFPEYIKKHPSAYAGGKLFWEHAHRDWYQIPIELGAGGCLLLLIGSAWWFRFFFKRRVTWHSLIIPILLGCSQTLVHACFDFPFQNPAILCTWLALIAVSARWVELDSRT